MSSVSGNRRPLPPIHLADVNLSVTGGGTTVKGFGTWKNATQNLSKTHTYPSLTSAFPAPNDGSKVPEMYSFGYSHTSHHNSTSFSATGLSSYGSSSTAAPVNDLSKHPLQTPRTIEEMGTISYDGDGDVVMADLEDLKAIMDVMQHVHEKRFKDETLYHREIKSVAPQARIRNPTFILVLDTSFIISHLHLVETMVSLHEYYGSVVVVPWAVIQELDGLRKSSCRITTTSTSVGLSRSSYAIAPKSVEVSRLARQAVNWQLKMFQMSHKGVWGQRREECLEKQACGDDAILDCCRYFKETRDLMTVLLSDDRNLCVKARVYDLLTVSFEPGVTHTAHMILDKTLAEVQASLAERSQITSPRSPAAPYLPAYRQAQLFHLSDHMVDKDAHMEDAPSPTTPSSIRRTTHSSNPMPGIYHSPNLSHSKHSPQAPASPASRFPPFQPPAPRPTVTARPIEPNVDLDREPRSSVYDFLERAYSEIMDAIPALMHYRALASMGGEQYTLDYLNINLRSCRNLEDIESNLSRHWHTVFNECVSHDVGMKARQGKLSDPYRTWSAWARNKVGRKPRKMELQAWAQDWTSLWRALYNRTMQDHGLGVLDAKLDWRCTEKWRRQIEMMVL